LFTGLAAATLAGEGAGRRPLAFAFAFTLTFDFALTLVLATLAFTRAAFFLIISHSSDKHNSNTSEVYRLFFE